MESRMKKNYLAIAITSMFLLTSCGGTSDSSGNVENRTNEMNSNEEMSPDTEMFALNKNQCVNKKKKGKKKKGKKKKGPKNSVARAWLRSHNTLRRKHKAPDVKWSNKLAKNAQKFAKTCSHGHSGSHKYGENLAFASYKLKPKDAVGMWYKESAQYNYKNPGFGMNTGHFTQVVWKNTKQIGCGQAKCGWSTITVCQYYPAGNMYGQYTKNVHPPK